MANQTLHLIGGPHDGLTLRATPDSPRLAWRCVDAHDKPTDRVALYDRDPERTTIYHFFRVVTMPPK